MTWKRFRELKWGESVSRDSANLPPAGGAAAPASPHHSITCRHFPTVKYKRGRGQEVAGGEHFPLPATVFPTTLRVVCMFAVFSPPFLLIFILLFFSHCGCFFFFFSPPPGGRDLHTSPSSLNAPRRHRRPFFPSSLLPPREWKGDSPHLAAVLISMEKK